MFFTIIHGDHTFRAVDYFEKPLKNFGTYLFAECTVERFKNVWYYEYNSFEKQMNGRCKKNTFPSFSSLPYAGRVDKNRANIFRSTPNSMPAVHTTRRTL